MSKLAVVAVGGNAVNRPGESPTAENMFKNVRETAKHLLNIAEEYDLIITHGNGPQVGNLLVQQDIAKDVIPPFPIDVNDAQTQGSLGYMIVQSLYNAMIERYGSMKKPVCAVVTQIVVDKNDPAFENPTKPVGPFYSEEEAKRLSEEKGWVVVEDAGRGWRRVVPSPKPLDVIEKQAIEDLVRGDVIVVAAGGGGIPVIRKEDGTLEGIEAVIDKDRASSLLARVFDADLFIILTAVEKVYLNFGKPDQKAVDVMTVGEAERYMKEGHFHKGSMLPKVEAGVDYVKATGREFIITSLEKVHEALRGETGTRIVP